MPDTSLPVFTPYEARSDGGAASARRVRFLEATLSSIPDYVYAFDRQRRFVYANPATLAFFGLSTIELIGKTFAELDYPQDQACALSGHIDRIFERGVTIEDEIFVRRPTGEAVHVEYLWAPVRSADGAIELVVGVSRDTSERHACEEALRESEARLRAATELVGLGIYAWNPATGALQWNDRMRQMWGLSPDASVDLGVFEAGIHPDDLARVQSAIGACVDPAGDGSYNIEYRVIGRDDGETRHIATAGRMSFANGHASGFIGAAIDVTAQRSAEAAIRASESQFRSFAAHSSHPIWIGDPVGGTIFYRSAAYELIWGLPLGDAATHLAGWMRAVHPEDCRMVEHALDAVASGEVAQLEYRIIRPCDGTIRRLRETCFPIPDDDGVIERIGGITEDLTRETDLQVYVVSARTAEARRLGRLVRAMGHRVRTFESATAFLDVAAVLASGCVLVDLRGARNEALSIARELKARSITLPTIMLDAAGADAAAAVAAMKAGATDFVIARDDDRLMASLARAIAECRGEMRPITRDEAASAQIARLTPREREVLVGLVDGGTNKTIGQKLGISPRTVELHRAQLMNRLDATSLTELLQTALAAGIAPSPNGVNHRARGS
jgi:PAS domain S-box-containing protein